MGKYIFKRILLAIVSIIIVSAVSFFAMNLIPGGPFNKEKAGSPAIQKVLEERYNLDNPLRTDVISGRICGQNFRYLQGLEEPPR